MSRHEIKTKNGYDLFECSSALQKSIRRGLEEQAMYWAVELYDSNFAEYVWKRLRIMASEDVGLASPGVAADVWALYCMHKEQAKHKDDKNEPQRLFLTHVVLLLCRSRKSRMVDWTLIWAWLTHQFARLEVPDFALDKHNGRGRQLGRGWGHFFEEGTRLENMGDVPGETAMRERARRAIGDPGGKSLFD